MYSGVLAITLLFNCLNYQLSEGKIFSPLEIGKIFEAAVNGLGFPIKAEFPLETPQCEQVVAIVGGKNLTKYFLLDEGSEAANLTGVATFVRKRDDTGKPWLYIPKAQDHLYKWETQTLVVLKQSANDPKGYFVLMVYFREIGPNKFLFEWDKWKPRGPKLIDVCPCTMVDKFYHPCENWSYCKIVANVYDKSEGGEANRNGTTKTRRAISTINEQQTIPAMKGIDSMKTITGNEIPKGSIPAFGPFFWDIVDTPEEELETNGRIQNYQKNSTTPAKYYEGLDNATFSGYGDCDYEVSDGELKDLIQKKDQKKLLNFYFKTMRAQCMDPEKSDVQSVINSKLLLWNTTLLSFVFNKNHTMLKKRIVMSEDELDRLEIALHFATFSQLLPAIAKRVKEERENNGSRDAVTPFGKPIHRNTRMVLLMTLKMSDMIKTDISHHEIKLTRRLISNLKAHLILGLHSRMAFIAEGSRNATICEGEVNRALCTKTRDKFKRDILQPVALTYFLLFGYDPRASVAVLKMDTYTKFVQYYQYHIHFLENHFKNYGVVE